MIRRKRGLKTLGLVLSAMLALTAFVASSAQALTWDLEGKEINLPVPLDGRLKQQFLLLVPSQNLIIHCDDLGTEDGVLLPENTAHLSLELSECIVLGSDKVIPCNTTLLLMKLKILPFLHSDGKIYLLYEPLTAGNPFLVIHYSGEKCVLPSLVTVTGSVVYECENGSLVPIDCKTSKVSHLIKPANPALFKDELRYGALPAFLDGEVELFLNGDDVGKAFNALI